MTEENAHLTAGETVRWLILVALLLGCVAVYFLRSPRVPPVVRAPSPAESQ